MEAVWPSEVLVSYHITCCHDPEYHDLKLLLSAFHLSLVMKLHNNSFDEVLSVARKATNLNNSFVVQKLYFLSHYSA